MNPGLEADKASRDFTASAASAYALSANRPIGQSELPGSSAVSIQEEAEEINKFPKTEKGLCNA
jgi:hypothetical protein